MPFAIDLSSLDLPPIPTGATSPDGLISATIIGSGVFLRANYSLSAIPALHRPRHIRFYRADGEALVRVRSGDPAFAPGAVAHAYDDEAPLGQISIWYAEPLDAALQSTPLRARSEGVALQLSEPGGGPDDPATWIKSLEDPAVSMQVHVANWPETTFASRAYVNTVLGRPTPAIVADVRAGATSQLQVLTLTQLEREAFWRLLSSGQVMLTQSRTEFGRQDRYWLFGDVTESRPSILATAPQRLWTIPVTEIERPDTASQPMRLIGRSYADRLATYPSYADATRTGRTYEQATIGDVPG